MRLCANGFGRRCAFPLGESGPGCTRRPATSVSSSETPRRVSTTSAALSTRYCSGLWCDGLPLPLPIAMEQKLARKRCLSGESRLDLVGYVNGLRDRRLLLRSARLDVEDQVRG
jgi:hypothetical protein